MMDDEILNTEEQESEQGTEQGSEQQSEQTDVPADMTDTLISLLDGLNYPVYRQGSFTSTDDYPDSFFTYWNEDSPDHSHYDNQTYGTKWEFSVNFYSTDAALTYSVINAARDLLKQNNWIVPSKGYDIVSDEDNHTGRGLTVLYLEIQ